MSQVKHIYVYMCYRSEKGTGVEEGGERGLGFDFHSLRQINIPPHPPPWHPAC